MTMVIYLKVCEEEIKLLLGRTPVEANATSVKYCANKTDAKEIVRHIKDIDLAR